MPSSFSNDQLDAAMDSTWGVPPPNTGTGKDPAWGGAPPQPGAGVIAGAQTIPPQAAVDALANGPKVGVPPSLAMHNPGPVNAMANANASQAIYNTSPAVKTWVDGNDPAKVAATQDDFPSLASIGKTLQGIGQSISDTFKAPPQAISSDIGADVVSSTVAAWQQLQKDAATSNTSKIWDPHELALGLDEVNLLFAPSMGAVSAAAYYPSKFLGQYVPNPILDVHTGKLSSPALGSPLAEQSWQETFGALSLALGLAPEHGFGAEGKIASADALTARTAQTAMVEGKTLSRSPALMQDFIDKNNPDANVWVDPGAILDAHTAGHPIFSDMVGDVHQAAVAGRDVQMTLGRFMSETAGHPDAEALTNATRFRPDGISVDESNSLLEHQQADTPPAEEAPTTPVDTHNDLIDAYAKNEATPEQLAQMPDAAISAGATGDAESLQKLTDAAAAQGDHTLLDHIDMVKALTSNFNDNALDKLLTTDEVLKSTPGAGEQLKAMAASAKVEVLHAARDTYLKKIFADQKSIGMTKPQFGEYSEKLQAAHQALYDQAVTKLAKIIKRSNTATWREAYTRHYNNVMDDVLTNPGIKAYKTLTEKAETRQGNVFVDKDGKPLPFYHGSNALNIERWKVPEFSNHKVISFAEDPEFASRWASHKGQNPFVYVTNLFAKKVGDFRNAADVEAAAKWFRKQGYAKEDITYNALKRRLEGGDWTVWENPEMMKANGWDAVRMVETSEMREKPNVAVYDGDNVSWHYNDIDKPIRLDPSVKDLYPQLTEGLPKKIFAKGGMLADDAAGHFGYDSGETMLKDLGLIEKQRTDTGLSFNNLVKKQIEDTAAKYASADTGTTLDPAAIRQAAMDAIRAPAVEDLLIHELKALSEKVGGRPLRVDEIKEGAQKSFESMTVKEAANVKTFERGLWKTGRATERALEKGNFIEAFSRKQQQLLNHYQLGLSHDLSKEFNQASKQIAKWIRKPKLAGQDQQTLDVIRSVLEDIGLKVQNGKFETAKQSLNGVTLESHLEGLRDAGHEPIETDVIPAPGGNLANYKVGQFQSLWAMLRSLRGLGMDTQRVFKAGQAEKLNDILTDIKASSDELGRTHKPGDMREKLGTAGSKLTHLMRQIGSSFTRQETMLYFLDGEKYGSFMKYIVEPLQDAKYTKGKLFAEAAERANTFEATLPRDWREKISRDIEVPELPFGEVDNWIKSPSELMRLVLNAGTETGRMKLEQGFGWDPATFWQVVNKHLNEPFYWDMIDHVHEQYRNIYPEMRKSYRRINGIGLKQEKATPIPYDYTTPEGVRKTGSIPGGYFPIEYDHRAYGTGTTVIGGETVIHNPLLRKSDSNLFGKEYQSGYPPNKNTMARTKYAGPLSTSWNTVNKGLEQSIHDVSYRESIIQANKILKTETARLAISEVLGPEYQKTFGKWLTDIARENVYSAGHLEHLATAVQGLRYRMTQVQIGWNIRTLLKHTGIAAAHVMTEVAPQHLLSAVKDLFLSPGQSEHWSDYTMDKFGEVKNAMVNLDRDLRDSLQLETKRNGPLTWYNNHAFSMFAQAKQFEAKIVALGKYREALAEDPDENRAVFFANKAVRDTQGAAAKVDLPALYRPDPGFGGEVGKLAYLYTTFENTTANRNWLITKRAQQVIQHWDDRGFAGNKRDIEKIGAQTVGFTALPVAWIALLDSAVFGQPKNLKDFEKRFGQSMLTASMTNVLGGITPGASILGQVPAYIYNMITDPKHAKLNADGVLGSMANEASDGLKGALHMVNPSVHASDRWVEHAMATAGYITNSATKPFGHAAQYLWDFNHGKVDSNPINKMKSIAFGRPPK